MKKILFLLLTSLIVSSNILGQVNNYGFSHSVGTYEALVGGTSIIAALTDDDNSAATNIGFDFVYNSTNFTQFVANSNGHIRLGSSAPTSNFSPISTAGNTNAISFFGRDGMTGGAVRYLLTGVAPDRILTIEYPDYRVSYSSTTNTLSAQIKLYETTNVIEIIYGSSARNATYTAQVGIRGGSDATDYNNRTTNSDWAATTAGSSSTSTVTLSITVFPVSGTTFTWSPPAPMAFASSTTEQASTANTTMGAINQEVIRLNVITTGALSPFDVTSITFSTAGSTNAADIANAKIYYTTNTTFATTTQFGSTEVSPSGTFTVSGSRTLAIGNNYFWLAYDIAAGATDGNVVDGQCTQFVTSEEKAVRVPTETNPAGVRTILAPLSGNYNVGAGEVYTTLTGAGGLFSNINALGLSGNLTAIITTDLTEPGTFALNQWTETGAGNYTVTIQPSEAVSKTISGDYSGGLLRLNGADRVTIDGRFGGSGNYLTIQNTSTEPNTAAIQLLSLGAGVGATDNTIRNCNIAAGSNTVTSTFGIFAGGASISTYGTGSDNDDLTIIQNVVTKAFYGIYAVGVVTTGVLDNLVINENTIGSSTVTDVISNRGIQVGNATNVQVNQNTVFGFRSNSTTIQITGIEFSTNVVNATISRNLIYDLQYTETLNKAGQGISVSSVSNSNIEISNNVIHSLKGHGSQTASNNSWGIMIMAGSQIGVYYNSINMTETFGNTNTNIHGGIYVASGVSNLSVQNNVIASQAAFGVFYNVYSLAANTAYTAINYNDYFVNGVLPANTTRHVGYLTTPRTTLADWQTATTQDANSISADPQFLSEINLQPFTGSPVLATGTPIVGIATDYTGAVRSLTNPSIGAYESGRAPAAVGWANLQWPPTAIITEGQTFTAYARVWQDGVTPGPGPGAGIESWFGWSATNTDPATWSNWISGSYNMDHGNDDEWMANIGAGITTGTYYYASRFRTIGGTFQYGGYSAGFWNGTTNVSGVLTVNPYTVTSFPWTETFEDDSPSRTAWSQIQEVGAGSWTYVAGSSGGSITNAYAGTKNARFVSTSGTASPITKLISPPINLTGVVSPEVNFYYGQEFWTPDQNETKVYYRISSGDPWVEIAHYTTNIAAWTGVTLALPNPSATYQIAFEGINNYGYANVVDNVTVRGSNTWNGTVSTDWTVSGNWTGGVPGATNSVVIGVAPNNPLISNAVTVNNLTINGGVLSVGNGGQLTVNGALTNNAGITGLVLQSNASGTGSLMHNTSDVAATIKRYITGGQYHFASVPLTAAASPTAALFIHSYLWKYDPTLPDWVKYLNEADALPVTQGYMLWYTGANTTYSFAGNMNNGAFTAATPGGVGTFNLVPNPYPSAIDWDALAGWTKTNVANATYIYNNTQYASYVGGVGTNGGTNIIPAGQGYFVQASGGVGTLAMNNDVRVHSSQAFFNEPVINDLFRVAVSVNGESDETVVRFTESATASFDSQYDAAKLYGHASAPQLYTMAADNQMLSINSLAMTEGGVSVPLSFEFTSDGEITLQFSGVGSFSELQAIFIEDQLTGSMTNLRQHGSYSFNHLVSNDPDRFLLHFRDITGLDDSGIGWQVWSSDRKVYVNIPELNGQRVSIEMFDVLGSRLYSNEGVLSSPTIIRAMNSGVAIIRVSSASRVYTTKIFIQ
jgi:hypothetical protein